MISKFVKISVIIFSLAIIYFFSLTFISFRFQTKLRNDYSTGDYKLGLENIQDVPLFPNITVTSIPIKAIIANYYFVYGSPKEAVKYIDESSKINPHIFFPEFLKAKYFFNNAEFDSAHYYAKKAFYGWPKNLEHYKLYNKTLEQRKDTLEIMNAFVSINKYFYDNSAYKENFIDSYTNAKLRFMISSYIDEATISIDDLKGNWQKVYEFEGGQITKLTDMLSFSDSTFSSSEKYYFTKNIDTINLFFLNQRNIPISKVIVKYSDQYNTLILKQVDSTLANDSFYKRIE